LARTTLHSARVSGDLGHYDDAGTLYFDVRLKELVKYKIFHLYPNKLEELLMANEAVKDAPPI
jgi:acyl-CoA synthetase (AMP-forming)/AMP-acid ligase II